MNMLNKSALAKSELGILTVRQIETLTLKDLKTMLIKREVK